MALPVFALLMVAEATVTSLRGNNVYALKDFAGSMSQLGINIAVRLAIGGVLIALHFWLYRFRVFEVAAGPWGWLLTFVASTLFSTGITARNTGSAFCGVLTWCTTPAST